MEVCRGIAIAMCFGSSYFLLAGFLLLPPPFNSGLFIPGARKGYVFAKASCVALTVEQI